MCVRVPVCLARLSSRCDSRLDSIAMALIKISRSGSRSRRHNLNNNKATCWWRWVHTHTHSLAHTETDRRIKSESKCHQKVEHELPALKANQRGGVSILVYRLYVYMQVCVCVCICISRSISLLTVFNTFDAFIFVMNTLSPLSRLSHNSQRGPKNWLCKSKFG